MIQLNLSWYLCISCIAQSLWYITLLVWWFILTSWWWEFVVLFHRCFSSPALCALSKSLTVETSCLVQVGDCDHFFDDIIRVLLNLIFCFEESYLGWLFMEERNFVHIKNPNRVWCSCDEVIYMLTVKTLVISRMGFYGVSCLLWEVVWLVHICGRLWHNLLDLAGQLRTISSPK